MFKALGDPTRLRIFRYLSDCCEGGECQPDPCIGDICQIINGDRRQTTVMSFHLEKLRSAGLVETEKQGKNVCCAIDRNAVARLVDFLTKESK